MIFRSYNIRFSSKLIYLSRFFIWPLISLLNLWIRLILSCIIDSIFKHILGKLLLIFYCLRKINQIASFVFFWIKNLFHCSFLVLVLVDDIMWDILILISSLIYIIYQKIKILLLLRNLLYLFLIIFFSLLCNFRFDENLNRFTQDISMNIIMIVKQNRNETVDLFIVDFLSDFAFFHKNFFLHFFQCFQPDVHIDNRYRFASISFRMEIQILFLLQFYNGLPPFFPCLIFNALPFNFEPYAGQFWV